MSLELETSHIITLGGILVGQAAVFGGLLYRAGAHNADHRARISQLEQEREDYVIAAALIPQLAEHTRLLTEHKRAHDDLATQFNKLSGAVEFMRGRLQHKESS